MKADVQVRLVLRPFRNYGAKSRSCVSALAAKLCQRRISGIMSHYVYIPEATLNHQSSLLPQAFCAPQHSRTVLGDFLPLLGHTNIWRRTDGPFPHSIGQFLRRDNLNPRTGLRQPYKNISVWPLAGDRTSLIQSPSFPAR